MARTIDLGQSDFCQGYLDNRALDGELNRTFFWIPGSGIELQRLHGHACNDTRSDATNCMAKDWTGFTEYSAPNLNDCTNAAVAAAAVDLISDPATQACGPIPNAR
jgi:hypothetical protein